MLLSRIFQNTTITWQLIYIMKCLFLSLCLLLLRFGADGVLLVSILPHVPPKKGILKCLYNLMSFLYIISMVPYSKNPPTHLLICLSTKLKNLLGDLPIDCARLRKVRWSSHDFRHIFAKIAEKKRAPTSLLRSQGDKLSWQCILTHEPQNQL